MVEDKPQTAASFLSGISIPQLVAVVVVCLAFYVQHQVFAAHVLSFEKQAIATHEELKSDLEDLEHEVQPIELGIVRLNSHLAYIQEQIERNQSKLDQLLEQKR